MGKKKYLAGLGKCTHEEKGGRRGKKKLLKWFSWLREVGEEEEETLKYACLLISTHFLMFLPRSSFEKQPPVFCI